MSGPRRPAPGELAQRNARHDAFPLCNLARARTGSNLPASITNPCSFSRSNRILIGRGLR